MDSLLLNFLIILCVVLTGIASTADTGYSEADKMGLYAEMRPVLCDGDEKTMIQYHDAPYGEEEKKRCESRLLHLVLKSFSSKLKRPDNYRASTVDREVFIDNFGRQMERIVMILVGPFESDDALDALRARFAKGHAEEL